MVGGLGNTVSRGGWVRMGMCVDGAVGEGGDVGCVSGVGKRREGSTWGVGCGCGMGV